MSLLFGGKPEEVPLRRKILRVLVFAASKASTFLILGAPLAQGTSEGGDSSWSQLLDDSGPGRAASPPHTSLAASPRVTSPCMMRGRRLQGATTKTATVDKNIAP